MNEVDFVRLLKAMASSGRITFEMLDQELVARYEAADQERRALLKNAITEELRFSERLAQNLLTFRFVDQR